MTWSGSLLCASSASESPHPMKTAVSDPLNASVLIPIDIQKLIIFQHFSGFFNYCVFCYNRPIGLSDDLNITQQTQISVACGTIACWSTQMYYKNLHFIRFNACISIRKSLKKILNYFCIYSINILFLTTTIFFIFCIFHGFLVDKLLICKP